MMTQRLLSTDPELAYNVPAHAASHAGRVAVVRESAGIAAYLAGHYARSTTRDSCCAAPIGLRHASAIEADCERALGRLQQALQSRQKQTPISLTISKSGAGHGRIGRTT